MEQSSDAMAQYEKDLYKKALLEWRQSLIVTGEKSQTEYDRLLATLSGGALGISFAFVKNFIVDDSPHVLSMLMVSWGSWTFSILCVLFSHFFSTKALRKAVKQHDDKTFHTEPVGGAYDHVLVWLNLLGGLAFVFGAISMCVFAFYNLK